MALEHLVLGLIAGRARHGYALWRRIDGMLGTRGTVQRTHVYHALAALERRRLVVARDESTPSGPRRRIFTLTADGRASLRAWLAGGSARGPLVPQHALLVKLVVRARLGDWPARRELRAERALRVQRLRRDDAPCARQERSRMCSDACCDSARAVTSRSSYGCSTSSTLGGSLRMPKPEVGARLRVLGRISVSMNFSAAGEK